MSKKWVGLLMLSFSSLARTYDGSYNDAEVHFVDFFQKTEGIEKLIRDMDQHQIEHAFVMGLPIVKKWALDAPKRPKYVFGDDAPVYYYARTDDILYRALANSDHRDRLFPFITGFNPTDLLSAEQIEERIKSEPGFWKGIGEILTRHDTLSGLTLGEQARANHPALMKIYQVAAKYDLPVILHSNITSQREKSALYKKELEEALKKNKKTKFIWAHAGTSSTLIKSQNLSFLITEVSTLLKENNNLFILASWSLKDIILNSPETKKDWVQLIQKYPGRFMIGSDVVGKFTNTGKILAGWDEILDELPNDVAKKMAKENMLNIIRR